MPRSVKQVSILACLLLVALRVAIGWQFLYEGLWKLNTQRTSRPWSAEGYLLNAKGPFRKDFRNLVDDPDALGKLDFDRMLARWEDWRDRFTSHYSGFADEARRLTDDQKRRLNVLLDGPSEFVQPLAELPAQVDLMKFRPVKFKPPEGWYLRYNAQNKRLETNLHLVPEERQALLKLARGEQHDEQQPGDADTVVSPEAGDAIWKYEDAVNKLVDRTGKLSLKERLRVLLQEDPDRVGVLLDPGTVDPERPGKKRIYEHLLARYENDLKQAVSRPFVQFTQDHLEKQWREIQEIRAELVGPVEALTTEFHDAAYKLLTVEQSARGPVPEPASRIATINRTTIWSLIILGALLMAGLFSRLSALGAAGLLLLFYLPMPPLPGVPEVPGPEHSLFVNKNLIECVACLALATLPTGRWIGLDALVRRFLLFRKTD